MLDGFPNFFAVWSLASVAIAVIGGAAVGVALDDHLPRDAAKEAATFGLVFYAGQVLEALLTGDLLWPRIVSRFLLWLVYSVAVGIGVYVAYRWGNRVGRLR